MSQITTLDLPVFPTRIKALLIDYSVILAWLIVVFVVTGVRYLITGELFDLLQLGPGGAQAVGFLVLVLPVGIYLYATEASKHQATLGKRALRLKVVAASDGSRPSNGQIALRTLIKLTPWEIAHFSMWQITAALAKNKQTPWSGWMTALITLSYIAPISYILLVWRHRLRRGPHDLAAGTRVVNAAV